MRVTLLVNGPGELWGWVRPLSFEMKKRGWTVSVFILPCPFASGSEYNVAMELPVSSVMGPFNWIRTLAVFFSLKTDLVVQLGGDLLFGRALARIKKVPLACYSYGFKKGLNRCDLVATAFPSMADSMMSNTVVVGDLVQDGLKGELDVSFWTGVGPKLVFFPGSRPEVRKVALSYLKRTIDHMKSKCDFQYITLMSPFTDEAEYGLWEKNGLCPVKIGTSSALSQADLAITQPGTNTLEIFHMAVPAIVAVPFCFLNNVPVSGLKGWVFKMPGGSSLKDYVLRKMSNKVGFTAWPNRIANREVVPELIGDLEPQDLALKILSLLKDKYRLKTMRGELRRLDTDYHEPSSVLCDHLERLVTSYNES